METNLGKINSIFSQNIDKLFKRKDGGKIIKEYLSKIKNNKALLKEFMVFDYIENYEGENVKEFISEAIGYIGENINKKQLLKLNEELNSFLIENKIEQDGEIKNIELYENIHSLIFNKKGLKTINENISKVNNIVEFIENKKKKKETLKEDNDINITGDSDLFYKILLEKFNSNYKESLTEEEKTVFNTVVNVKNDEEKTILFENYKKDCLSLTNKILNEHIDNVTKEKLLNVKESLLEQKFNNEFFLTDILAFIDLKKTLDNVEDSE